MLKSCFTLALFFVAIQCYGQPPIFSEQLVFDTLVYPRINLSPPPARANFNVKVIGNAIYMCYDGQGTDNDFQFYKMDVGSYIINDSFRLTNTLKSNRNKVSYVSDFDIKGDQIVVLSYNGWQVYEKQQTEPFYTREWSMFDFKNNYERLALLSDSTFMLARAYKWPQFEEEKALHGTVHDFKHDKTLASVPIRSNLPELSFFGPCSRMDFYKQESYFCDFADYKVYKIDRNNHLQLIINDTSIKQVPSFNSRLKRLKKKRASDEQLHHMIIEYLPDSFYTPYDLNVVSDSCLIIRSGKACVIIDSLTNSTWIDVWVKNTNGSFVLKKSYLDAYKKLNTAGNITSSSYYKSTLTTRYTISNGKIYFFYWSAGVYPIGLTKKDLERKEADALLENPTVPTILIYDIKDSFY